MPAPRLARGRGRAASRDIKADLETLLGAAAIEQFLFLRGLAPALLEAAAAAFAGGQPLDFAPFDSAQGDFAARAKSRAHQERLARLYAAARALGLARVRLEAGLALISPQGRNHGAEFAEALKGVAPKDAIRYLERLPVIERSKWEQFIRQSQRQAFTVSGIEQKAALESLKSLIEESLRSGLTAEQFNRQAAELLKNFSLDARRLRTVWNTSVGNAMQQGREAAFEDPAVAALLTYGLFDALVDEVVRPNHEALEGAIAPRSWWLEHGDLIPLLGFNCRCQLLWITGAQARRMLEAGQGFDITAGIPATAGRDDGFPLAA